LARWLRGAEQLRPRVVDGTLEAFEDEARVTASFTHGEVFLKDDAGDVLRLVFDGGDEPRAVPAGRYRFFGYRIVDGEWMLSATGGKRALEVAGDTDVELEVDPRVHVDVAFKLRKGEPGLNVGVTGSEGLGLTIYREGRRVALPVVVADGDRPLTRADLEYG
jgi:hypothetical protein